MYNVKTTFNTGATYEDGPFPTHQEAQHYAVNLPYFGSPGVDVALIDLKSPVFYKDVEHWALRVIDGREYLSQRQQGVLHIIVAGTREAALELAAESGHLEWLEAVPVTPSSLASWSH